jgi:hypothetical protein
VHGRTDACQWQKAASVTRPGQALAETPFQVRLYKEKMICFSGCHRLELPRCSFHNGHLIHLRARWAETNGSERNCMKWEFADKEEQVRKRYADTR